jgi:hypothetical protein
MKYKMPTFIGLDHDFTVKLNDQDIIAQRTFAVTKVRQDFFFSAFADITAQQKKRQWRL